MNITVLNKDIRIENNKVVITENVETTMDKNQLEFKLRDLQMKKSRLQDQNVRLVTEYNELIIEETETNNLISQLTTNDGIEEI